MTDIDPASDPNVIKAVCLDRVAGRDEYCLYITAYYTRGGGGRSWHWADGEWVEHTGREGVTGSVKPALKLAARVILDQRADKIGRDALAAALFSTGLTDKVQVHP